MHCATLYFLLLYWFKISLLCTDTRNFSSKYSDKWIWEMWNIPVQVGTVKLYFSNKCCQKSSFSYFSQKQLIIPCFSSHPLYSIPFTSYVFKVLLWKVWHSCVSLGKLPSQIPVCLCLDQTRLRTKTNSQFCHIFHMWQNC